MAKKSSPGFSGHGEVAGNSGMRMPGGSFGGSDGPIVLLRFWASSVLYCGVLGEMGKRGQTS